jgi:hypothetical protein
VLYLLLAVLAVDLAVSRGAEVDTKGALATLADNAAGKVLLVILAVGFAAFALWHLFSTARHRSGKQGERLLDVGRAVVYGALSALAVSFLLSASSSGADSEKTERAWTARVLEWPGGRFLVAGFGAVVIGVGLYLLWRSLMGDSPDSQAERDAAPNETPAVHTLGAVGNAARGGVVVLIGAFFVGAAIDHDPNDTVGLDGALKRLLDTSIGTVLVLLVAAGFAAFGLYCIARAYVNRGQVAR